MGDSSPNPSRPGSAPEAPQGQSSSRASVPPSEPRASRTSFSALEASAERPARLQLIVALILLLVLVAVPLYLWRRPRAESITVSADKDAAAAPMVTPPSEEKPILGEAKTLSCHDPGPKKTPSEQCDHLPDIERALAKAIEENASCVPRDTGGGSIGFVADVNFKKKAIGIATPKESRSLKNEKVVAACRSAIRAKMEKVSLDTLPAGKHEHSRYRIQIIATYPGTQKP